MPIGFAEHHIETEGSENKQDNNLGNSYQITDFPRFRGAAKIDVGKKDGREGRQDFFRRQKSPMRNDNAYFPEDMSEVGAETKGIFSSERPPVRKMLNAGGVSVW